MNLFRQIVFRTIGLTGFLLTILATPLVTQAHTPGVDPQAIGKLKNALNYLGSLRSFRAETQVTIEDISQTGHRTDSDVFTRLAAERPNKLFAHRLGEPLDQRFYYDGEKLTLYSPKDNAHATVPAPATIEEVLNFARDSLGLMVPAADLIYQNAFDLMVQDVNFAMDLGKTTIFGRTCDHLIFSRPGVDFQLWVASDHEPVPCKYVVTDTAYAGQLSVSTVVTAWESNPSIPANTFEFEPPAETQSIIFLYWSEPKLRMFLKPEPNQ